MKCFILLASAFTLFSAIAAQAETFVCTQTEPFITDTFDMSKGTVKVVEGDDEAHAQTESGLKLVVDGSTYMILNQDGSLLRKLTLNHQGSDGMSEKLYTFDGGQGVNGPIGCEEK